MAIVGLAIDAGRDVLQPILIPQVGVTRTYSFGTFGPTSGQAMQVPRYGITGFSTGVTSARVFTRHGLLRVFRPLTDGSYKVIFEARAISEGSCSLLSAVAPNSIAALFHTFPIGGTTEFESELKQIC